MPRKEGVTILATSMSKEALEGVKSLAAELDYESAADYVRTLIQEDMQKRGRSINFGLTEWGMGRKKKPE